MSLGTYYVVMMRTESYEKPLRYPEGVPADSGVPVRVVDNDQELAEELAWTASKKHFPKGPDELSARIVRSGADGITLRAPRGGFTAAAYEQLRPILKDTYFYVVPVPFDTPPRGDKQYILMRRTFYETTEEDYVQTSVWLSRMDGTPVAINTDSLESAQQQAWELTLPLLPNMRLVDFMRFANYSPVQEELLEEASKHLARGIPRASIQRFPKSAPAAFYEALRPLIQDHFYYVVQL